MKFAESDMLWFLAGIVPLLSLFLWRSWRKRQYLIRQFVHARLLSILTIGLSTRRHLLKNCLMVSAVALLIITLARPHWNYEYQDARQEGLDILVALDTSRSMLASDMTPDRLTRAKLAIRDLLLKARNDRLGLIAFAGTAFLQCPLTVDADAFQQSVDIIEVGIIPQGGSNLTAAIQEALKAFEKSESVHRILVIFSDGEDHDGRALQAARKASEEGIRIFTIGVGTSEGQLLQVPDNRGNLAYIRDSSGNFVKSRLDETLLRQVAGEGEGTYLALTDAKAMDSLYERGLAPLPRTETESRKVRRPIERYQWPLGLALVCLAVEIIVSDRKQSGSQSPRRRSIMDSMKTNIWILTLFGFLTSAAHGSTGQARKDYENGDYQSALEEYLRLEQETPDDARLDFNAGAAAFRSGDFERAVELFKESLKTTDLELQQKGYYNNGNALFRLGEEQMRLSPQLTIDRWTEAIQEYENAIELNSDDEDAEYNKDLVERKLMALKRRLQQQGRQQGNQQQQPNQNGQGGSGQQNQQSGGDSQQQQPQNPTGDDQGRQEQEDSQQGSGEQQQPPQQPGPQPEPVPQDQPGSQGGQDPVPEKLTPEQARQLLENHLGEEKAMLFLPRNQTNTYRAPDKDW